MNKPPSDWDAVVTALKVSIMAAIVMFLPPIVLWLLGYSEDTCMIVWACWDSALFFVFIWFTSRLNGQP